MAQRKSKYLGYFWLPLLAACAATGAGQDSQGGKSDDPFGDSQDCPRYAEAIQTGHLREPDATELSGLVMSQRNPGVFWAHNDGDGDKVKLYALDREGQLVHELKIRDIDIVDMEDIAVGPGPDPQRDYLYLADTGDNPSERKEVRVIRIPEPNLDSEQGIIESDVDVFRFRYDDKDPHDAEALFVDPQSGAIYVITKHGDDERHTRVYRSDGPLDPLERNTLIEVLRDEDAPELEGSVVAADISRDGRRIALLFKDEAVRSWTRHEGESIVNALSRPACRAPSAPGQQEALAYSVDGQGYYLVPEGQSPAVSFVAPRRACPEFDDVVEIGAVDAPSLQEVSGLVVSGRDEDVLWAVNDSGHGDGRNQLIAINRAAQHLADIQLPDTENQDWEDLALGPGPVPGRSYLYIADTGDNDLDRGKIEVYRLAEPKPGEPPGPVERFTFEYPNDRPHDAESLLVDPISGDVFFITRRRGDDRKTRIYRASAPLDASRKIALKKVLDEGDNSDLKDTIVAADISIDGLTLALARREGVPLVYQRNPEGPAFEALKYRGCRAVLSPGQHDSIALDRDGGSFFQLPEGDSPSLFQVRAHQP